jgi:hypothetical protein
MDLLTGAMDGLFTLLGLVCAGFFFYGASLCLFGAEEEGDEATTPAQPAVGMGARLVGSRARQDECAMSE